MAFASSTPATSALVPALSALWTRLGALAARSHRAMVFSRTVQALSSLDDAHLARMGLTRAEIGKRAHEVAYGSR